MLSALKSAMTNFGSATLDLDEDPPTLRNIQAGLYGIAAGLVHLSRVIGDLGDVLHRIDRGTAAARRGPTGLKTVGG
jgi:hypothetical protein